MWREAARYEPRMQAGERERLLGALARGRRALAGLGRREPATSRPRNRVERPG